MKTSFVHVGDHYQFEKLARIYDKEKFVQYLVANFINDEDYILGMSQDVR